mgnify:CR=1 FL=1
MTYAINIIREEMMMLGKKINISVSVNEITASAKRHYLEIRDLVFLGICFILYAVIMIVLVHLVVLSTPWAYPLLLALIAISEGFCVFTFKSDVPLYQEGYLFLPYY